MQYSRIVLLAVAAQLVCACASTGSSSSSSQSLSSPMSAFQPSKANPNQMVYQEPGVDLKQYHSVMIDPLLFVKREASGKVVFLSAGTQNDVGNYFQQQLRRDLAQQGVQVSEQPGVGVARIQAAVTGLDLQKPDMKIRDLLPTKLAIDLTKKAVGKESYFVDVSSMTQLVDSKSNKLLVRAMNMRKESSKVTKDQALTLADLKEAIDAWCQVTSKQLATHLGATSHAKL